MLLWLRKGQKPEKGKEALRSANQTGPKVNEQMIDRRKDQRRQLSRKRASLLLVIEYLRSIPLVPSQL
jgi:hypothetical protein